jgi:excinuclease UvrABC ATPase subunit
MLDVTYKDKNIYDVLEMDIQEVDYFLCRSTRDNK